MSATFKIGNALACEHIVEGPDKKHILINTVAGNLLVAEFPATIPLSFYIEFMSNQAQEIGAEITLLVGKKVTMKGDLTLKFDGTNPVVLTIPSGMLTLKKPTTIKLMVAPQGGKPIKAIEKKLILLEASPIA